MPLWFLLSILLGLYNSDPIHRSFSASRHTIFDDFVVRENISEKLQSFEGLFNCFLACSGNRTCQTLFYNELDGYCQLNTVKFFAHANWEPARGMHYYEVYGEDCPKNNGYIYNKDTNMCFKIYDSNPLRWVDAREMCKRESADLIVLDTIDKYNYIKDTIMASPWLVSNLFNIGASDVDLEGDWRWVNGLPLSTSNSMWAKNEPNNHGDQHYAILETELDDENGEKEILYICELPVETYKKTEVRSMYQEGK